MGKRSCPGRTLSLNVLTAFVQEVGRKGLTLALPSDYKSIRTGLPIHIKSCGPMFMVADDRLILQTRDEALKQLEAKRCALIQLLDAQIRSLRSRMEQGSDAWLLEKRSKIAAAFLANPAQQPHPLIATYAHLQGLDVNGAAQALCESYRNFAAAVLWLDITGAQHRTAVNRAEGVGALLDLEVAIREMSSHEATE